MFRLTNRLKRKPSVIPVDKAGREILEYFIAHKNEFEAWASLHLEKRISFRFYFPNAIDFCYDGCKLFTAYFKRDRRDVPQLHELKMSDANLSNIATTNWKPFEDVMVCFLKTLEEHKRMSYFQQTKSLYDYAAICESGQAPKEQSRVAGMNPALNSYPLASQ